MMPRLIEWAVIPAAVMLAAFTQDNTTPRPLALSEVVAGELTNQSQFRSNVIGAGYRYECFRLSVTPRRIHRLNVEAEFQAFIITSRHGCMDFGRGINTRISDRWNVDVLFSSSTDETYITVYSNPGALGRYVISAVELPGSAPEPVWPRSVPRISAAPYASYKAQSWGESGAIRGLSGSGTGSSSASTGTASTVAEVNETRETGEVFADCETTCPSMVVVPAGTFMMGSPASEAGREASEGPRHVVTIQQPFAIGRYEVTFEEYDACVAARGCDRKEDAGWGRGRRPVINLTYRDAQRYIAWLSRTTGQRYFIPSEAEWEYAARAGTSTPWNTGTAVIGDDANILNQFGKTVVVGGYAPNAFGLYDTIGNVAEWTQDCIDTGYVGAPADGSAATSGNCDAQAVTRGGHFGSPPTATRSAHRKPTNRTQASTDAGLRVARAL